MRHTILVKPEAGFSLMELMVSMIILVPIMGAALSLFSLGAHQQASEQSSVDVNQEARAGMEMMTREIAQAGSRASGETTTQTDITGDGTSETIPVNTMNGLMQNDWVNVEGESVKLEYASSYSITGKFSSPHDQGATVRLFPFPFAGGVVCPAGLGAEDSKVETSIKFFGDIGGNSVPEYIEYVYDSANNQITRSATPLSEWTKHDAIPFIRNVKPNSVHFTLFTDSYNQVTSVNIEMTIRNTVSTASKYEETQLSSRVSIPNAVAASVLLNEVERMGGENKFPSTPPQISYWGGTE